MADMHKTEMFPWRELEYILLFNQQHLKGNGEMGLLSDKRRLLGHGLHFQTSVYSSAFICSFQNLPEAVDFTRFQGRSIPSKQVNLVFAFLASLAQEGLLSGHSTSIKMGP